MRQRYVSSACLTTLSGVLAAQLTSFSTSSDFIWFAVLSIVVGYVTGAVRVTLFFIVGAALFAIDSRNVIASRISSEFVGDSIMAEVEVGSFPRLRGETVSFVGEVRASPWVPRRIAVSWQSPGTDVRLGEVWRLELRLRRPRGNSNPGGFDVETWLFRQRIAATAFVVDSNRNVRVQADVAGPLDRYRRHAVERLGDVIAESQRAAVLAAISIGARHLVSPAGWERYAASGTSHLMAISGLHVGMVAAATYMFVLILVSPFGRTLQPHRTGCIAALGSATAYALLSGMAVPAQRATLMIALATMAVLRARQVRPFRIIAVASATLACASPLATLSPGFYLSFLAVLVLVWIARRRSRDERGLAVLRPLHGASHLLSIQMALLLGLMPFTILFFGRVAIAAPLVNLVAVPVFSAVTVPSTLLGLLLDGAAGDALLQLAGHSLAVVERAIDLGLWIPTAPIVRSPGSWAIVLLVLPAAWVILPAGWPGRHVAGLAAVAVITAGPLRPQPGCAEVTVIDVGQGLAVLVTTHSSSLLYDSGPAFFGGGNAAQTTVLPYLQARGIRSLGHLVISHGDLDHMGGFATITAALDIGRLHLGRSVDERLPGGRCLAGMAWTQDRVRFEFVHPHVDGSWSGNDSSCVLQIAAGAHRILLTGDIEHRAEATLARSGTLSPVDVVVVPHHGSRTSSSPPFVDALRPRVAIVSAGYGNRWGQPSPDVVARWQAAGAEVVNTATSGAISFTLCERSGTGALSTHRNDNRRAWHE